MNNVNTENYKFAMPLSIRWNDLDPLAHVNNVYYFEYFQIGRGHYMHAVSQQWDWQKYMFVIVHIECDYLKELSLSATNPTIKMRTSSLGNKSFEIEYLITSTAKDGSEILHAKGKSVQVMIDIAVKKPIELPEWLRKDINAYEPAFD